MKRKLRACVTQRMGSNRFPKSVDKRTKSQFKNKMEIRIEKGRRIYIKKRRMLKMNFTKLFNFYNCDGREVDNKK